MRKKIIAGSGTRAGKRHFGKFFLWLAGIACALLLCGNFIVKGTVRDRIFAEAPDAAPVDCIIVLGCGVNDSGKPMQMLRCRLDKAVELYEKGVSGKLLMSGDHGRTTYDEVNAMKAYAIEKGVPSEDIFMDHAGFSTYETMYRAGAVFCVKTACIVTQKYHLYRSVYDAEKLGIDAIGVPAAQNKTLKQLVRDAREVIARNKDLLYCLLKPLPKYLGDEIPVTGNGDVTNDR